MKIKTLLLGLTLGILATSSVFSVKAKPSQSVVDAASFSPVETSITNLDFSRITDVRQRFIVSLSTADWGDTPIEKDTTNSKISEYNYHTSIFINDTVIADFSGWNQRCIFVAGGSKIPKLYFDISHSDFVANDKITFLEGCEFPSYEYVVNGSGNASFRLAKTVNYIFDGSHWLLDDFEKRSTEIVSVKFTLGSAANKYCYMSIALTNYDYLGGEMEDAIWTEMTTSFNVNNIKLNGKNIVFDSARQNRYRAKKSTIMLYVYSQDGTGSEYTSVFIPALTDFPSKEYHDSKVKSKYVVEKDTTLYQSRAGFVQGTKANKLGISRVNETRLRFVLNLTNFDHDEYTSDGQIEIYPSTYPVFDYVKLDGETMTRWPGMADTRAYKFSNYNSWGFDFQFTANLIPSTVIIKQGALFASTFYVDHLDLVEKYYVLTEDIEFRHVSGTTMDYGCVNTVNDFCNNALKMDSVPTTDSGTGKCASEGWYSEAKEQYLNLLQKDKTLFNSDESYADARARLSAWALANGEVFNNGSFVTASNSIAFATSDNDYQIAIFVIITISIIAITSLIIIRKKRSIKDN